MTPRTVEISVNSSDEVTMRDARSAMNQGCFGQIKHVPSGTGAVYSGPGNQLTFIATGKETGGAFFLAKMDVLPGGGPPPHIHRSEDESFHVLEGTLTIQVGGETIIASAGDFAFLPRGIAHAFKNTGSTTARALVIITPAGLENYFAEVFERVADASAPPPPPSKEMIARAREVSPRYGLELLPLP